MLRDYEIRSEPPIETRQEGDDPVAAAAAAVNELRQSSETFRTNIENRITTELRGITDRLTAVETRSNRPSAQQSADQQAEQVRAAISTYMRTGNDTELRSAAATDNNPDGGWFVLPTVDTSIRNLLVDISPMRGLAEVITIGSGNVYETFFNVSKRGAQKVVERDDRPQDTARPGLIKHSYGVGEYYAAPTATRQMLSDASTDIAGWLMNNATQDFALSEGEDFWNYDGSNGFPKGLLQYPVDAAKDFTREWGKFQYIAAGATNPTDDQLNKALVTLMMSVRKQYRGNARWVFNTNTAIRIRQLQDTNKRFLWAPTGNLLEGEQSLLLGFPVEIDENAPDIASGNTPIAFGDFKQGYIIVDREGIKLTRDEVTQKGRVVFDTYKRTGGGAGDFNAIKFLKISNS
ncbi:MAG: phage major capsid protein [Proteobacteria bacterium]|nr:phage major capsid protein [Pseudomonadota bacterium]